MHFLPTITTLVGVYIGGPGYFGTVFLLLVFHPLLDLFTRGRLQATIKNFASFQLWFFSFSVIALNIWSLWYISVYGSRLHPLEFIGMIFSIGISIGIGFTAAHELIHRRARWERALGLALLSQGLYMHYRVEHIYGHHKRVATHEDPSSARYGESLYAFWFRSLLFSAVSAWHLERKRCGDQIFSMKNRIIHYILAQAFGLTLIGIIFGPLALLFFVAQATVAVFLLESIHYIEHYGLQRKKNVRGEYEPYTGRHAWDTNHGLTNQALFNVGRHSHHHRNPTVPWEDLEVLQEAPLLPVGYSAMLVLAICPPLWRAVVHPKIANQSTI